MAGIERRENFTPQFEAIKPELDVFVPESQEQGYLERNHLQVEILPNGALLFAGHRDEEDILHAKYNLAFPNGAYFDEPGKKGIRHILEHLIANKPAALAQRNGVNFNASTEAAQVSIYWDGTSNTDFKDYGTWPVLNSVFENVIKDLSVSQEELEKEKLICIEENFHRTREYDFLVSKASNEIVFGKDNPYQVYAGGTNEEISQTRLEDIGSLVNEVFVPKDMVATLFTHGDRSVYEENVKELKVRLEEFPRSASKSKRVKPALFASLNPDFKNGEVYLKDTGLRNNNVNISLNWVFDYSPFATENFAFFALEEISTRFHEFIRKNGLSYVDFADVRPHGDKIRFISMGVKTSRKENLSGIAELIKTGAQHEVFDLKDDEITQILERKKKERMANPIKNKERFDNLIWSFVNYGRIVDEEKARDHILQVTKNDVKDVLKKISSTPPAILIVGDLE